MTNKQIFTHYRFYLGFQKFPKYLKYIGQKYINSNTGFEQLHHCLGSVKGKKFTDALIIPLTAEDHNWAEKQKADYFVKYFHQSVAYFVTYARQELNYIDTLKFKINPDTGLYEAVQVAEFIQKVHDLECGA